MFFSRASVFTLTFFAAMAFAMLAEAGYPACRNVGTLERKYPLSSLPENLRLVSSSHGQPVLRVGQSRLRAAYKGWSSYWYPITSNQLFAGPKSPLKNYDQWAKAKGAKGSAADWHAKNVYNPKASEWEGYCAPRAFAAAVELIPTKSVQVGGVCFSPADIKALLSLSYETVSSRKLEEKLKRPLIFGQQFLGGTDDVINDVYPDQLLRFIQVSLGDRQLPFLMDHAKDSEMWMDIVHEATIEVSKAQGQSAVDVKIILKMANFDLNESEIALDDRGQLNFDQAIRSYTARLYGCWHGEDFVASSGEWTGPSEFDHPDYVVDVPLNNTTAIKSLRGTSNPQLNIGWIYELRDQAMRAQKSGQFCTK